MKTKFTFLKKHLTSHNGDGYIWFLFITMILLLIFGALVVSMTTSVNMRDIRDSVDHAASDVFAANCIRCLKKLGRNIPQDVKVIGYDNISICEFTDPTISTIAQPIVEMGELAAETLFKLIKNEAIEQFHISLPVKLIERESTALLEKQKVKQNYNYE